MLQSEKDDRHSDPNLEEKLQQTAKALNEEKRKSARRKEYERFCLIFLLFAYDLHVIAPLDSFTTYAAMYMRFD